MCHTLIIEDDWLIAMDMGDMVAGAAARSVAFAASEEEAVREARRHRPFFIFSDINLRAGTGPIAVQRITQEHGSIPTVFITALPETCHPCDDAKAILTKPCGSAAIVDAFLKFAPI